MSLSPKFTFEIDSNGCWICQDRYVNRDGYPQCKFNNCSVSAAKYVYSQLHGDIPEGLHVLHKCGNRRCINPEHLYLGNHKQNMKDRTMHGNHPVGRTKLTTDVVREIKGIIKSTDLTNQEIGDLHDVSRWVISRIRRGNTWKAASTIPS